MHVERLAQMALPSIGRFDAKSRSCLEDFEQHCVGPAHDEQAARLQHALQRERARFEREYNDRLYSGLIVGTLILALLSRFVLKRLIIEVCSWASFIFLMVRMAATSHCKVANKTRWGLPELQVHACMSWH